MNRRLTVALAAAAACSLGLAPVASAAKNEIRIVGGVQFKAGKYVKDNVRFKPRTKTVKSGATVKVINKAGPETGPHTISFVRKRFLPKSFAFEGSPTFKTLLTAHAASMESEEIGFFQVNDGAGVPNEQAGVLEVNSLGGPDTAGDSQFMAPGQGTTFKVTAAKGSTLPYYCAIHAWMQGRIKVN
jgi:plastocyanin